MGVKNYSSSYERNLDACFFGDHVVSELGQAVESRRKKIVEYNKQLEKRELSGHDYEKLVVAEVDSYIEDLKNFGAELLEVRRQFLNFCS